MQRKQCLGTHLGIISGLLCVIHVCFVGAVHGRYVQGRCAGVDVKCQQCVDIASRALYVHA